MSLQKDLDKAKGEIEYLKRCLAYLAQCNVANYEELKPLKSVSKSRKARYKSIASTTLDMLNGDWAPRGWHRPVDEIIEDAKKDIKNL